MADRTATNQEMQKGYPDIADILVQLNAAGIEAPKMGDPLFIDHFWEMLWGIVNSVSWAMALGVYKESDTTYRVRAGSFVVDGVVVNYAQEAAVDPTDNDTTYVWMNPDGTVGAAVDGTGWPATAHIKLASIVVDASGVITSITDLRGTAWLQFSTT